MAEGSAEVFVHHGADVSLEVSEEDAAGTQVLGSRRQLLVFLFDRRGAEPGATVLGILHFGIQGQFLRNHMQIYICVMKLCVPSGRDAQIFVRILDTVKT